MKGIIIVRCKDCKKVFEKTTYKNVKWSGIRITEFTPQELGDYKFIKHKCKKKK